ncbi:MAG: DUF4215 domain-containing protein [Deltaproteobacteria bacterium]|nr:MAG: DUF4215 domain-containing protein [Deltaproteobacteria bacterium]
MPSPPATARRRCVRSPCGAATDTVVLTAVADPGSTFTGWTGPCTGSDTTCSFKASDDVTVGASFDLKRYTVTVALAGAGMGTVTATPGGLSCPGTCSVQVDAGAVITLTATPATQPKSKFVQWGAPSCSSTAPCVMAINGDQTITAIFVPVACGNGVVDDPSEECDDGNTSNNDACTNACLIAKCGDGFAWTGHEECDNGANNNDHNACTSTCKMARCGDGLVFTGQEECDDANSINTDACTNACKNARCGDGIIWSGHEGCDEGSNNSNGGACTTACATSECGDGFVWIGHEECDNGVNNGNNNACTIACKAARCGDGFTWTGHEECDDGNGVNTDACTNACKSARCGDGFAWTGHEECDDGNTSNSDDCTNTCKMARCGDGFTWTGHEECDNGINNDNSSACTSTCRNARCGDSFTWAGHEDCDDGNLDNNDHCDNSCHCGGPGQVCCATGSLCDTGNGCLQNICTACPGPPQTHTLPSTTDTNGNNCAGIDFVKTYPARCDDGYHHEACTTTIVATPGDASCDVVGWANPNDPGDCSCSVHYIVPFHPFDCGRHITCTVTVTETTNTPPHPVGCP